MPVSICARVCVRALRLSWTGVCILALLVLPLLPPPYTVFIRYTLWNFFFFYILSFIEMTEYFNRDRGESKRARGVCVSVCVSVCLWTFLTARPDRTRGPIFMNFGTRTKMLIRYELPIYFCVFPVPRRLCLCDRFRFSTHRQQHFVFGNVHACLHICV